MVYTPADIQFSQISSGDFERLCYHLLLKFNFVELAWRQGGGDNGRDIEGYLDFKNALRTKKTKWFFECKHYTSNGVPPEQLNSKIAWADAESPDFFVVFVSSYITTGARTWLERIKSSKKYEIIVIEGEEIKSKVVQFSDLVENFFSANIYEQLFLDGKRHWQQYQVQSSYIMLKEIIQNIAAEKFSLNDLGFLFFSFYKQFRYFKDGDYDYGYFDQELLSPLYSRLAALSTNTLELFELFKGDYQKLGGSGFLDDADTFDEDEIDEDMQLETFQYYDLHLNHKKSRDNWAIGYYIFFKTAGGAAFELFMLDNSDFATCAKTYPNYSSRTLEQMAIRHSPEVIAKVLRCYPELNVDEMSS